MAHVFGYVRVSTAAQTLEQQNAAFADAGVPKTLSDSMSGARDDRPGMVALMDYVCEGDTVVVSKLDRRGRNTSAHLGDGQGPFRSRRDPDLHH